VAGRTEVFATGGCRRFLSGVLHRGTRGLGIRLPGRTDRSLTALDKQLGGSAT